MSKTFGPAWLAIPAKRASDVSVMMWNEKNAYLTAPIRVLPDGKVTFTVKNPGTYKVRIREGVNFYDRQVSLTEPKITPPTPAPDAPPVDPDSEMAKMRLAIQEMAQQISYLNTEVNHISWDQITDKPSKYPTDISPMTTVFKDKAWLPEWEDVKNVPDEFTPKTGQSPYVAKPGDWKPRWVDIIDPPADYTPKTGSTARTAKPGDWYPSWDDIRNRPDVYPTTLGTRENEAKPGNWFPAWTQVTGKPSTFPAELGLSSSTAKPGDWVPSWSEVTGKPSTYASTWSDISDKPSRFPAELGTSATTAKAGDWTPSWSQVSDKPVRYAPELGLTSDVAKPGNWTPDWSDVRNKPNIPTPTDTAQAAQKLSTPRRITLSGGVTGSTTFDGTADVTVISSIAPATTATFGGVKKMPAQPAADALNIGPTLNGLIAKLKDAGFMNT